MSSSPRLGESAQERPQSGLYMQFLEYLDIANIRGQKHGILQKARADLLQHYIEERQDFDSRLIANHPDQLTLFQGQLLAADHLSDAEHLLEEGKLEYRKKVLAYLLANREEIEKNFRQQFILARRESPTYGEIMPIISEEATYNILYELSPNGRIALFQELDRGVFPDSHRRPGEAIFRICQAYPHLETPTVNLYSRADLETFYGHLVGSITGIGKNLYEQFFTDNQVIEMQLASYQPRRNALPLAHTFGKLAEPMRIFMIQEQMRAAIDTAAADPASAIPEKIQMELFNDFGQFHQSVGLLEQFFNLPANGATFDQVRSIVGKPSRRNLLNQVRKSIPGDLPVTELYQLMAIIQQINSLRTAEPHRVDELAVIFLMELEQAMQIFNSRTARFTLQEDDQVFRSQIQKLTNLTQYTLSQLQTRTK